MNITEFAGLAVNNGNAKLGKHVGAINRMPVDTCPGASDACKAYCYAQKGFYPMQFDKYKSQTIDMSRINRKLIRFHTAGDFDTIAYIEACIELAQSRPDTKFWAYTRSWRIAKLLPALENLRALPNVQLFASMDSSIPELPPTDWRVAFTADDTRFSGPTCMEQTGIKPNCESCGYCFIGSKNNIKFALH